MHVALDNKNRVLIQEHVRERRLGNIRAGHTAWVCLHPSSCALRPDQPGKCRKQPILRTSTDTPQVLLHDAIHLPGI